MQGGTPFSGVITPLTHLRYLSVVASRLRDKNLDVFVCVPVPRTWSVGMKEVALFSFSTKQRHKS